MSCRRPPAHIVVPVDFSAASAAAVALAGRIASTFGARLTALHVEAVEVPPYFTREQVETLDAELRLARQRAEAEVKAFVARHTAAAADVTISDHEVVEAILGAASAADLIVMGTHGRRGPKRWWLGSVAERTIREAAVPVLVAHAGPEVTRPGAARLDPVVLTTPSESTEEARAWAECLAAAFGGQVRTGPHVQQCASGGAIAATSIVVVPMPADPGSRTVQDSIVALARVCPVPVLFVPAGAQQGI
jgi:nucleotide-binding universal stress UspA family protein